MQKTISNITIPHDVYAQQTIISTTSQIKCCNTNIHSEMVHTKSVTSGVSLTS